MIILIDMDNTLADFDKSLLNLWKEMYPNETFIRPNDRKNFHPHLDYPPHLQEKVLSICHSPGFIRNLPPIVGAIEAVNILLADGHNVRFCTSYLFEYKNSVLEKFQWIEEHFGKEAVERIIFTRDKTLIRGDIIIDDKPEIFGVGNPTWEHIIFDRPYNRKITGKRRLTWTNWRGVVYSNNEIS